MMVGYGDLRYHSELYGMSFILLLTYAFARFPKHKAWLGFAGALAAVILITDVESQVEEKILPKLHSPVIVQAQVTPTVADLATAKAMLNHSGKTNPADVKVFFLGGYCFNFGAYTGVTTYGHLENITERRLIYLLNNIQPHYIYAPDDVDQWREILEQRYTIEKISNGYPIYSIRP